MALRSPPKKPFISRMAEMPVPWRHRTSESPEERSPDGHRSDVFTTLRSAALIVVVTLLVAWFLFDQYGY